MTEFKRIAFVGLGQMGLPMAKNLVAGGFPVVGFDAFEQARVAASAEGIEVASSLNEAVEGADCIITMLPNGKIVQDVVLGGDAFLKAREGAVLLEMSSSAPTDTRVLSDKVSPHLRVVDAPVSGGVKRAVSGSLTIMAGGETEALNQAMPVLNCLASGVFACGPVGAGHAMKSINNFVSGAGVIAAVEAVALGTAFGLSADTIIDVLNASWNPIIKKLTFTGSTEVGRILMAQGAKKILKLSLELGGNAPFIVFDDADIDAAIQGALISKFRNNGQTCVCANRIYAQSGIYDRFVEKLGAAVAAMKVGDGFEDGTVLGPLINDAAKAKLEDHIADALSKGASVVTGAEQHALGGTFVRPTVLKDVTSDMKVAREETFAPLAPVFKFETAEEVIKLANDTEFGLASYFYANDLTQVWKVAEALEYGMVGINTGLISTEVAPFGGVKQSGFGREGSKYGLDDFLSIKYLCLGGIA